MLFSSLPMGAESYYALVASDATEYQQGDARAFQGKRVGINQGSFNDEVFLKDCFPDWTPVPYPTVEERFRAVAEGAADCALFSNYRLSQLQQLAKRYKLTQVPTGKAMHLGFALRRGEGGALPHHQPDHRPGVRQQH